MQPYPQSKRLHQVALTVISIAVLLVLCTASCATRNATSSTGGGAASLSAAPGGAGLSRSSKPSNQLCHVCHDEHGVETSMQLYVLAPGHPGMDDYEAAEPLLKGAQSTAMGFSHAGCNSQARGPVTFSAPRAELSGADGGIAPPPDTGPVIFQAGPPPPRVPDPTAAIPPSGTAVHAAAMANATTGMAATGNQKKYFCKRPSGYTPPAACAADVGDAGIPQEDGVVFFQPAADGGRYDYAFVPCAYLGSAKNYRAAMALPASQRVHATGAHAADGGSMVYTVTIEP